MTAGTEAIFLQVKLLPWNASFFNFPGNTTPRRQLRCEYTRHVFDAKNSPTCANYAFQETGRDNKDVCPLAAVAIARNFDMDDFAMSVDTPLEASELNNQLKTAHKKSGFKRTKWVTNDSDAMKSFNEDVRAEPTIKSFAAEQAASSLLESQWNMEENTLQLPEMSGTNSKQNISKSSAIVCVFGV